MPIGIQITQTTTVSTTQYDHFQTHTPLPQLEFATPKIHRTPRTLDGDSQVSSLYTLQGSSSGSPALPTATPDPGIEKAPQKQKSFHHAGFPMIPTLPPPQSHSRDNPVASPSTTASNSAGDAASISDTKCGCFSRGPATGWRKRLFSSSLFGSRSASQALSPQEDKQFILDLPVDSDHVGGSGLLSQTTLSPSSLFWDESTPVVSIYVPQSILSPAESLEVEANMQDAFNSERYRDYPVVSSSTAADSDDDPTLERLAALCRNVFPTPYSWTQINLHDEGTDDIWKGRLHDTQVCLKVLRIFISGEDRAKVIRDFCWEALVWRQLRHPNVLPFLGVSEDLFALSYCLISPWMVNGNIMSYLQAHPDHDRLTSVAEAMEYLHNLDPPIIHADIRGGNILVADDQRCCLADFGLSLIAESQNFNTTSGMRRGNLRWLAPEYILPGLLDQSFIAARDTYAYGCTVIEVGPTVHFTSS
ncbi:uncharacterized protein ARMOST_03983 [Armillaria ostoyae]|uniref:Protein kinase domain-containing protein n=1 Tax=Armillaria ostoyae TaxID=47428 RepID=A0A284QW20_ARMOS|nr:uncharacterized protein ARMOST_03983 [Armillaria ostoyae]